MKSIFVNFRVSLHQWLINKRIPVFVIDSLEEDGELFEEDPEDVTDITKIPKIRIYFQHISSQESRNLSFFFH